METVSLKPPFDCMQLASDLYDHFYSTFIQLARVRFEVVSANNCFKSLWKS